MGKREIYERELNPLLEEYLRKGRAQRLLEYLGSRSNLPGPRANLELLGAFASLFSKRCHEKPGSFWELALKLAEVSRRVERADEPMEFVVMSGILGIAAVGATLPRYFGRAMGQLRGYSRAPRWRTREGVAMGLQRMIESQGEMTLGALKDWVSDQDWMSMRAVAAGVAEPAILKDRLLAKKALELHRLIFSRVISAKEWKSEEFRVLRQTLGYSLSVVVHELPEEAFAYMRQILRNPDQDIRWMVRENMKKDRLAKNFPDEVRGIAKLIP